MAGFRTFCNFSLGVVTNTSPNPIYGATVKVAALTASSCRCIRATAAACLSMEARQQDQGDDIVESLGKEYATRCAEEGFGGIIYGRGLDQRENAPSDAEKPQGSDAKEKEDASQASKNSSAPSPVVGAKSKV